MTKVITRVLPWRVMPGHSAGVQDHAAQGDWLVTAGMDQTVALWYLPDVEQDTLAPLEPALKLFVSSDNEWVVWSASGYYAASLHGDRYVGYHVNQGRAPGGAVLPPAIVSSNSSIAPTSSAPSWWTAARSAH